MPFANSLISLTEPLGYNNEVPKLTAVNTLLRFCCSLSFSLGMLQISLPFACCPKIICPCVSSAHRLPSETTWVRFSNQEVVSCCCQRSSGGGMVFAMRCRHSPCCNFLCT